jgi:SRSO17 transposase
MPTILEHPQALALLEQATLTPEHVAACSDHLTAFLQRYLPLFQRREQRTNATRALQGRLSGLERKTSEPIAHQAGVPRKPLQAFVGWAPWDDEACLAELRRHVQQEWADPDAAFIVDGSAFPKKGTHSCGVARQYCGRTGKVDNCQLGIFLAYSCRCGHVGIDRRLFLPKEWAAKVSRRAECHVPPTVTYQEHWQIALELIDRGKDLPHGWVTADSEFGRVVAFRSGLRQRGEPYVLEVRADTLVRDLGARRPRRQRRFGRKRAVPFRRVDAWARRQPARHWQRLTVRPGEKGPLQVDVLQGRVRAWADGRKDYPEERLTVIRTVERQPRTWYTLSNAAAEVPMAEIVRAHAQRHRGEEVFAEGKGEVGLGQYEVRRWDGWHHHMTLCLLALWFLGLERQRVGGEKGGGVGEPGAADLQPPAAPAAPQPPTDCRGAQPSAAA